MSLGTRLSLKTAVLVTAVLVVAVSALWGLGGVNRDLDAALGEYNRMRESYALMSGIEQARAELRRQPIDDERIRQTLLRAVFRIDEQAGLLDPALAEQLNGDLKRSLEELDEPQSDGRPLRIAGPLNAAMNRLAAEIDREAELIAAIEQRAEAHRTSVVVWISATALIAALLAIAVGLWQYAAVMRPLRRLQRGVQRLASGDFADRLADSGDREFVQLAHDFNRMADELSTLYQELENKVRLRSAQLAQSERLASVGFLAAGVAHEINNPLAIIAGEAELALRALPADAADESRQTLTAIRDEAFRCKTITQKLLSLASPGSGGRVIVDLKALAEEVAELVRTLPQHVGRTVSVQAPHAVKANTDPAQVKQVLLNLVINALEAVPAGGQVRLDVKQRDQDAILAVNDDGKGISQDALGRVFEPFYTEKKSPTTPGLGLGLSISYAIIEDLGGRLTAHSDGPGKGSTFTIELPIA